jgi:hypothetical protein
VYISNLIEYMKNAGFSVFPDPNFIPNTVADHLLPACFVYGNGGYAPHEYVPTERPTFQVVVKGKSYKTNPTSMLEAEVAAKSIIKHFHRKANYSIGNHRIFSSQAMQSNPIPLGRDEQDRPMYSVNLLFYTMEDESIPSEYGQGDIYGQGINYQ